MMMMESAKREMMQMMRLSCRWRRNPEVSDLDIFTLEPALVFLLQIFSWMST
jgi:hypothetical protein